MATSKAPTIADYIEQARLADEAAQEKVAASQLARQAEIDAKNAARAAWDTIYDQLVALKTDSKDIESFRSSKLGKLLENAR